MKRSLHHRARQWAISFALGTGICFSPSVFSADFTLAVQPVLSPEKTMKVYVPLIEYLSEQTGHNFKLITHINYVSYWLKARSGTYDLLLDAPHFTAYQVKNLNYTILAKVKGTISFSLVSAPDSQFFSADDLVGKRVATTAPPSLAALALQSLFSNPMREPRFVNVNSAEDAINQVFNKKAVAALIPTPIASRFPDLNTIQVTQSYPHMAMSASPKVPQKFRKEISEVLLQATSTDHGRDMLSDIKISSFEPANLDDYMPYVKLLTEGRNFQHAALRNGFSPK